MPVSIRIIVTSNEEQEAAYAAEPQRSLTFSFPERLTIFDFELAVSAYREVFAKTSVKPMIVEGMLPLWLSGHMRSDHRVEVAALGALLTDGISFQWPEFTEWRSRFILDKVTPSSWNVSWETMKNRRLGLRQERIGVLARTINSLLRNRWEAAQQAQCGREGDYEIVSDCPASRLVAAERLSSLVVGDAATYPPYFPGDLSTVRRTRREAAWPHSPV